MDIKKLNLILLYIADVVIHVNVYLICIKIYKRYQIESYFEIHVRLIGKIMTMLTIVLVIIIVIILLEPLM